MSQASASQMVVHKLVPMHAPMIARVLVVPMVALAVALARVPMHVFLAVLETLPMSLLGHPRQLWLVGGGGGGGANAVAKWRVFAWSC